MGRGEGPGGREREERMVAISVGEDGGRSALENLVEKTVVVGNLESRRAKLTGKKTRRLLNQPPLLYS